MFATFLIVGARVFDPLTVALTDFTELRYKTNRPGERIIKPLPRTAMGGARAAAREMRHHF